MTIILSYIAVVLVSELSHVGTAVVDPVMARITTDAQIRVGYDPGIIPFTMVIADTPVGFDIDLMRLIARDLGVQVVFVPTNLDAAYDELQQGHIDVMASAMPYAPAQGWRARFSQFYFDDGLVRVSRLPKSTATALPNAPVGVVFGGDADTLLRSYMRQGQALRVIHYDTLTELWTALECAQIDTIVVEQSIATAMVRRDPALHIGMALSFAPYVLVMPYDALYLNDAINRALQRARDTGAFTQLTARWMTIPVATCATP